MGQSLAQVYIHLIIGTKNRYPFLNDKIEDRLHAYLAGTLKAWESPVLKINSVPDHVHILFRQSKNYGISKIVEELKKQSSRWVKDIENGSKDFAWQIGYGAFSVSYSKIELVSRYIQNQKEHHKKQSFREEVEAFFKTNHDTDYHPEYFWR